MYLPISLKFFINTVKTNKHQYERNGDERREFAPEKGWARKG